VYKESGKEAEACARTSALRLRLRHDRPALYLYNGINGWRTRLDTLRLSQVNNMAAGRDGDTAVWLHNKLGSTDDLWSGSSICSHLTRERLLSIQECFLHLQPHVKVKLMLSFLHLPKRSVEEVIWLTLTIGSVYWHLRKCE